MREGLYKMEFSTSFGTGSGVINLRDGLARGGNSVLYYVGEYELRDNLLHLRVKYQRHSHKLNEASVFGLETAHVTITGEMTDDAIVISGIADEIPDMLLTGKITFLTE
ncbi:MAG: GrlR family regulatory protein [Sneathiella sp.]